MSYTVKTTNHIDWRPCVRIYRLCDWTSSRRQSKQQQQQQQPQLHLNLSAAASHGSAASHAAQSGAAAH